jgi:hypothetical protein
MSMLQKLIVVIPRCWGADTSVYAGTWRPANAASGQCAVTALVVEDFTGLKAVRGRVEFSNGHWLSHYWNEDSEGRVDLTASQFAVPDLPVDFKYVPLPPEGGQSVHDYLLNAPATAGRYNLLKHRVLLALGGC